MNNRTPFVLLSALATLMLGAMAWLACYSQEATRSARGVGQQSRDAGAQTEHLASAPVVVPLPAVDP
jgi:hypothetical protein